MLEPTKAMKMAREALILSAAKTYGNEEIVEYAKGILQAEAVYQGIKYGFDLIMKGDFHTGNKGLKDLLRHLRSVVTI